MSETWSPHLVREVISFCESCFETHGDSSPGVGWLRNDADTRYRVMLDIIRPSSGDISVLDFGCGLSHLYDYILRNNILNVRYAGLDISERFLQASREKYPDIEYFSTDVLDPSAMPLPPFDYVVMNGIFTYKGSATFDEMFAYMRALVKRVFQTARVGIAFNVMSKQVDWERDDLFHLYTDMLLAFLSREVSRHIVIRHDYGLYEYTVYVYKAASDPEQSEAKALLDAE